MVAISPLVFLLILAVISAVIITLILLYRDNRRLFWCVGLALAAHVAAVSGTMLVMFIIARLFPPKPEERRVTIAAIRKVKAPETKKPKPEEKERPPKPAPLILPAPEPKVKPPPMLAPPKGRMDGSRTAKVMPKGKTLKTKIPGKPGPKNPRMAQVPANAGGPKRQSSSPSNLLTRPGANPDALPDDPEGGGKGLIGEDGLHRDDIPGGDKDFGSGLNKDPGGGGDEGEDAGDPEGHGKGAIPVGFAEGKINGRVYFMRLKHGSGAWDAWKPGTQRLLAYLNTYFKCEGDGRAITAHEMSTKYMRRKVQPSFLYLYCDDSFSLSGGEISILRTYIDRGGFLFLDSRPDLEIKARVARQLDRVLPGTRLAAIPRNHAINSFLFKLSGPTPGVGENAITQQNYGITQNNRLVVFYTMGNFSHIFDTNPPDKKEQYVLAQYQMGANVMLYGINKGNPGGLSKRPGASAKVTTQAFEQMGLLDAPAKAGKGRPGTPGGSIKVKRTPKPGAKPNDLPDAPDDIKVFDD